MKSNTSEIQVSYFDTQHREVFEHVELLWRIIDNSNTI